MSYPFDPFAECSQQQRTECTNGLSYKDLAQTAWNVYRACSGLDRITINGDADRAPWEAVAGKAAQIVDIPESEMATREVSARGLAKTLYMQYNVECGNEPEWKWGSTAEVFKTAWEAVGRHLANLIDSDGQTSNFQELEERIIDWARQRAGSVQIQCG